MKITIERKYKKKGYTIGNLYIDSNKPLCNTLDFSQEETARINTIISDPALFF